MLATTDKFRRYTSLMRAKEGKFKSITLKLIIEMAMQMREKWHGHRRSGKNPDCGKTKHLPV